MKAKFKGARTTAAVLGAIAALWLLACVAIYALMCQPPETFGRVMSKLPERASFLVLPFETLWIHARAGRLRVGDPAPDFNLSRLEAKTDGKQQDKQGDKQAGKQTVSLSLMAQGRPVVLVFGSYT